ncbi:MAG: TIGR02757 family protein [Kiritimatiellia bacterium]|jgi:uncharacterized protein (TIGR02757 family)|nr:TIGR02757 family protein [Kiritimatiellia bacterium]
MTDKGKLNSLYRKYNKREYVHPDPLEFLYDYKNPCDREIVGIVASALAYGRVAQILKSVRKILDKMGPSPSEFLDSTSPKKLSSSLAAFKHRFTTGEHMASLLLGVRGAVREYGSLNECFVSGLARSDKTVLPALDQFVSSIACNAGYLLPSPSRGSACKRLNLFLRWMVRKDRVDPGGWQGIPKRLLVVPLDIHMATIGRGLGFSERKSADMKMAIEITRAFARFCPSDPVKYDFALTRFGIRDDLEMSHLLDE